MVVFVLHKTTEAEANAEPMQPLVIGKYIKNSLISLYKTDVTTSWWYVNFLAKRRHDVMAAVSELIVSLILDVLIQRMHKFVCLSFNINKSKTWIHLSNSCFDIL